MGGIAGAAILFLIASGKSDFDLGGFASNGYDEHSPGGYGMTSALIIEVVITFIFLFVILRSTYTKAPRGFAGLAIGLCLTLIHLISIPVTNTSVNPARSTSQALFCWRLGIRPALVILACSYSWCNFSRISLQSNFTRNNR